DVGALRERMNEFPRPNVVFVLDVDERVGLSRVADRDGVPNLFENVEQLSRARRLFLKMNGDITVHLDAAASIEAVRAQVFERLVREGGVLQKVRCAKGYGCDDPIQCGYRLGGDCYWWNLRRALYTR
ncbi:MAG: hypothetical protein JNM10_16045, partial [Planctomycetia bacterium]|nr:hypothetical protein [Planctomycetia bacterium]